MTDLNRLKVSLTKHNAHKVARLLKDYPASKVFSRLSEVHAEPAQARKNLSVMPSDALPPVWRKVQALGPDAIDALTLVSIIFSHNALIKATAEASNRQGFTGRIERGKQLEGKAYTNFVRILDQLGFATKLEQVGVTFNFKRMFRLPGLGPLVGELIGLKLLEAQWDQSNTVVEEAVRLRFEKVFGISAKDLKTWLSLDAQPASAESTIPANDESFFDDQTEGTAPKPFKFKPGHIDRDVEPLTRAASKKSNADRLHNDIQNKLHTYLKKLLGAGCVGTEQDTGSGTAVDVATLHNGEMTFYEIKTGLSVRSSIRQALPQLLEYAYWPDDRRANKLIIVSHLPATDDADRYIRFLQNEFNLPISYQQFDMSKNVLR